MTVSDRLGLFCRGLVVLVGVSACGAVPPHAESSPYQGPLVVTGAIHQPDIVGVTTPICGFGQGRMSFTTKEWSIPGYRLDFIIGGFKGPGTYTRFQALEDLTDGISLVLYEDRPNNAHITLAVAHDGEVHVATATPSSATGTLSANLVGPNASPGSRSEVTGSWHCAVPATQPTIPMATLPPPQA